MARRRNRDRPEDGSEREDTMSGKNKPEPNKKTQRQRDEQLADQEANESPDQYCPKHRTWYNPDKTNAHNNCG